MELWRLHKELAYSLGDPVIVEATSPSIPDGVRFSKDMRDMYLYRAMTTMYNNTLMSINGQKKEVQKEIIKRMYPNSILVENNSILGTSPDYYVELTYKALVILHATTYLEGYTAPDNEVPLVINDNVLQNNGMVNASIVQKPHPFGIYSVSGDIGIISIKDRGDLLTSSPEVSIAYLPEPLYPGTQGLLDELMIDNIYTNQIIKMSTLYGMIDSQDVQDPSLYQPNL